MEANAQFPHDADDQVTGQEALAAAGDAWKEPILNRLTPGTAAHDRARAAFGLKS